MRVLGMQLDPKKPFSLSWYLTLKFKNFPFKILNIDNISLNIDNISLNISQTFKLRTKLYKGRGIGFDFMNTFKGDVD